MITPKPTKVKSSCASPPRYTLSSDSTRCRRKSEQRLRTLQKAFISTLKDPQFLAEAGKAKLEIDPVDGPGIEKMVNRLYEIEPAVVSRVKQLLEAK